MESGAESASPWGVDPELLVRNFVGLYADQPRQRTAAWYARRAEVIGGSELAALMTWDPYSSPEKIVATKTGVQAWGKKDTVACRWGVLFEPVIERFVEIDCGTRVAGTDISIPSPPGSGLHNLFSFSPDGYAVLTVFLNAKGDLQLLETDAATLRDAEGRPQKRVTVLLEFKCPFQRRPKGEIPRHYRPQIWAGLALSPIAHLGVYVDAGFRKCALWSLGPKAGYDRTFHLERTNPEWTAPIAWGLTGVFARRPDTAADDEASLLFFRELGIPLNPLRPEPIDFGECETSTFTSLVQNLDGFSVEHVGPCFPDGRGADLRNDRAIEAAVNRLAAQAPADHYLLGLLPWKIFEVDYVFQERRPAFLEFVGPLIRDCLKRAEARRGAPPGPSPEARRPRDAVTLA